MTTALALVPLTIEQGARVLEVGCGPVGLTSDLAAAGATVTALENDPTLAGQARAATEGLHGVTVIETTLEQSLAAWNDAGPSFDVAILHTEARDASASGLPLGLEGDLEAIDLVLRPGGVLLILGRNPMGLSAGLESGGSVAEMRARARTAVAADDPGPSAIGTVIGCAATRGYHVAGTYFCHPSVDDATFMIGEGLERTLPGQGLMERLPIAYSANDVEGARSAQAAFDAWRWSAAFGIGPALADGYLLVFTHAAASPNQPRGGTGAWVTPSAITGSRSIKAARLESDTWYLRSADGSGTVRRGPFEVRSRDVELPPGRNGGAELSQAFATAGAGGDPTRRMVGSWWDAAAAVLDETRARDRSTELMLGPQAFVMSPAGAWSWAGDSISSRMPLPNGVVAFGSMLEAVAAWTIATPPHGLDAAATVGDAVRILLAEVGIYVDAGMRRLWFDIRSDLMLRMGLVGDREEALRGLRRAETAPLMATAFAPGGEG